MYIILVCSKAKMSKCVKCNVHYCTAECLRAHWPEHKPLCHEIVAYLARKDIKPGSQTPGHEGHQSAKARKHNARMRSYMNSMQGSGFQFLDEATFWHICGVLELPVVSALVYV